MTLRCLLFGHLRSRSRATFDEKHRRWLSECKRCHVLMVREPDGKWREIPSPIGKLVPIERESEESAAPDGSPDEPPFVAAAATDSTERGAAALREHRQEAVELSAS